MSKLFSLGSIVVILVLTHILGLADVRALELKAAHPAPGQLVDVGGYKMHIYCIGDGSPTVIMEAGLGNPGLVWTLVQPEVAKQTRVCIYDRAGLGWSDPSPRQRTAKVMVDELHILLGNAHVDAPYILVGHSFGGLLMRLYAVQYPDEVKGIVLVDSYHFTQMDRYPKVHGKGNALIPLCLEALRLWIASGIPSMDPSLVPALDLAKLPPPVLNTYRDLVAADSKSVKEAQEELAFLEQSGGEEKEAGIVALGNIPLVVLSHGYLQARAIDPIGREHHAEYETFWRADQAGLASLSPQGKLIIAAKSGHYIQLEQPQLVISSIERVLARAQP